MSAGLGALRPIPACWIGTAHPTISVNRVISIASFLLAVYG
jgi:hypothetical protein